MSIKIQINGKEESLNDGMSIGNLLAQRKIRREVVTVELNGNIIEKESYDSTLLKDGDALEFIYYMGGGAFSVS